MYEITSRYHTRLDKTYFHVFAVSPLDDEAVDRCNLYKVRLNN